MHYEVTEGETQLGFAGIPDLGIELRKSNPLVYLGFANSRIKR